MPYIEAQIGGGGSISLSDIAVGSKSTFHTITAKNTSWQADRDCIMCGKITAGGSSSAIVYFEDSSHAVLMTGANSSVNHTVYIGYNTSSQSAPTTYGIFVPKGTTVITRNAGTYSLYFYEIG